ncbi:MAG: hypothetical protein ACI86X_001227 [Moritella sp.]|jgi:hypothetical protein
MDTKSNTDNWQQSIAHLKNHMTKQGDAMVPHAYKTDDGFSLGQWVSNRKRDFKQDNLEATNKAGLNELGFI